MFRDRRLTWADVTERTRRLANYLHRPRARLPHRTVASSTTRESGRTTSRSTCTTATSTSRRCSARSRRGSRPFNVNYRYVAEELRYLLNDAKARAIVVPLGSSRRRSPRCCRRCRDLEVFLQVADDSGNELLPGAVWYEDALAAVVAGAPAGRARRPTTCTSSTPAARRACPRACCGAGRRVGVECFGGSADADHARGGRSPRRARRSRAAAGPAVHARRRPLDEHADLEPRRHHLHPGRPRTARPRRHLGPRSSASG